MNAQQLNRRDVLKAASAASGISMVGTVHGKQANEGSVRLIEVGLEYELPKNYDYQRYHVDNDSFYSIDSTQKTVTLGMDAPPRVRHLFRQNQTIVRGPSVTTIPTTVWYSEPVTTIPTTLISRYRPHKLVSLTEPHQPPMIELSKETSGRITMTVENNHETLEPNSEQVYRLSSRTIEAETYQVTNTVVEVEGLPEHRWGPDTEYDSVTVEAVPKVLVQDFGELAVRSIVE